MISRVAALLIQGGARMNATDDSGVTGLWLAFTKTFRYMVEFRLQAGTIA
jgi:hypothetical protein